MDTSLPGTLSAPSRLSVILARTRPLGVILRRGPSKWVQIILWHTDNDTFDYGQWFKGRIYEHRCDVSPDGSLFIYFASKITGRTLKDQEYTHAWTAISRPPYLTALALWPEGDTYGGGGIFLNGHTVKLHHDAAHATPHPAHRPRGLRIITPPDHLFRDTNLYRERLERDGWRLVQKGIWPPRSPLAIHRRWEATRPIVWQRAHPPSRYALRWELRGYDADLVGGEAMAEYAIEDIETHARTMIVGASWAEWDQGGRLVFVRDGCLYGGSSDGTGGEPVMLADFNAQRPYELAAPAWAREW